MKSLPLMIDQSKEPIKYAILVYFPPAFLPLLSKMKQVCCPFLLKFKFQSKVVSFFVYMLKGYRSKVSGNCIIHYLKVFV